MGTWCPAGLRVDRHRRQHHRRGGGCLVGGLHPRHLASHQDGRGSGSQRQDPRHRHGPNSHLRFVLFTLRVKSRRPFHANNPEHRRSQSQPHAEREEYGSANNPGVSSGNKIALGLNPKVSTPQPSTANRATPSSRRGQQLFPTGGIKQCGDHPREPIGVRDAAQRVFGLRARGAEPPPAK